jgi:hypothetical protein
MQLPRLRFTVQLMMAVVALVAMALTVDDQFRRRRESFKQRALECMRSVSAAYEAEQAARFGNRFNHDPRTTAAYYVLAEHYSAMQKKYEQATTRPWLFVGTDLPEPDWPEGVPR